MPRIRGATDISFTFAAFCMSVTDHWPLATYTVKASKFVINIVSFD